MPEFEVTVKPKGVPDAKPFTVTVNGNAHHSQAEAEQHVTDTQGARLVVVPKESAAPAADAEAK
jgi:hypothetical protein